MSEATELLSDLGVGIEDLSIKALKDSKIDTPSKADGIRHRIS
jgi:hypothetical protein